MKCRSSECDMVKGDDDDDDDNDDDDDDDDVQTFYDE